MQNRALASPLLSSGNVGMGKNNSKCINVSVREQASKDLQVHATSFSMRPIRTGRQLWTVSPSLAMRQKEHDRCRQSYT